LSTAALSDLSDSEAIETNWPGSEVVPRHSGFDLDLDNLYAEPLFHFLVANPPPRAEVAASDPCLALGPTGPFYVHVKSGTRIYEAYSMLDQIGAAPGPFAARLNAALGSPPNAGPYDGPWAFATLGGWGEVTEGRFRFVQPLIQALLYDFAVALRANDQQAFVPVDLFACHDCRTRAS
jgi:hypothetical protein